MSAADVVELFKSGDVTRTQVRKAVHHLTKPERAALYDDENSQHRSSVGKFFEAVVYELLLSLSESSDKIVSIAAKLSDAEYVPYSKYEPDGLWYSKDGNIRFKELGSVTAEMDLLIKTSDNVRVFGEVIINPSSVKGFRSEVSLKKHLLEKLYGDPVEFLLILPTEPPLGGVRCLSERDRFVVLSNAHELYRLVHPGEVMKRKLSPTKSSKRVDGRVW